MHCIIKIERLPKVHSYLETSSLSFIYSLVNFFPLIFTKNSYKISKGYDAFVVNFLSDLDNKLS